MFGFLEKLVDIIFPESKSLKFVKGLCENAKSPRIESGRWTLSHLYEVVLWLNEVRVTITYDAIRRKYNCDLYTNETGYLFFHEVEQDTIQFLLNRFDLESKYFFPEEIKYRQKNTDLHQKERQLIEKYSGK